MTFCDLRRSLPSDPRVETVMVVLMLLRSFSRLYADFLIRTVTSRFLLAVMLKARRPISTLLFRVSETVPLHRLARRRAARQPHLRAPALVDPELALADLDREVRLGTRAGARARAGAGARTGAPAEHAQVLHGGLHDRAAGRSAADALEAEAVVEGVGRRDGRGLLDQGLRPDPVVVVRHAAGRRPTGRPAVEAGLERRRRARHTVDRAPRCRRRRRRALPRTDPWRR